MASSAEQQLRILRQLHSCQALYISVLQMASRLIRSLGLEDLEKYGSRCWLQT